MPTSSRLRLPTASAGSRRVRPTTSGDMPIGLTFDASGNIWGFCQPGRSPPVPALVWNFRFLSQAPPRPTFVAHHFGPSEYTITSRPAFDSSGSLYGLTENAAPMGNGTIFYLPAADHRHRPFGLDGQRPRSAGGIVTTSNGVAAVRPTTTTAD